MADNIFNAGNASQEGGSPEKPKGNRGLLYGILIVALAATWGYLIFDKSKSHQKEQQLETTAVTLSQTRDSLQTAFNASLAQIDQLKTTNDSLKRTMDGEISKSKARIQAILSNEHATKAELAEARRLIAQLNSQVEGYKEQIEQLQGEKLALTNQRDSIKRNYDTVYVQKQQLTQQVELGSVLHASDIRIVPLHLRHSGKEITTSKAKRVDMMRVSFNVDENRISTSGQKTLYVCITAPDGSPLAVDALGSGKFTLADGTEKLFTTSKTIDYETGKAQNVSIDWKQNSSFKPGDYKVQVYEAGYQIGQGDVPLRKGGLF